MVQSAERVVYRAFKCRKCGYTWAPRPNTTKGATPIRCPGCNTREWQPRIKNVAKCSSCDYEWQTRVAKPKACPNCFVRLSWD